MYNTKQPTAHKLRSLVGVLSLSALLGVSVAGCGAADSWNKQVADAWSVTYEVSVSGASTDSLHDITYLQSPGRGEESTETSLDSAATTSDPENSKGALWQETVTITAEDEAGVAATVPKGATATCRILLDGVKEIQSKTVADGQRVECKVQTPAFSK